MIQYTNDFDFPIEIIKSKRKKTASIKLKKSNFEIRVPKHLSNKQIKDLIINWSSWMKNKLNELDNYSLFDDGNFLSSILKELSIQIEPNILDNIKIITVKTVDEVIKIALIKELKPVEWIEVENLPKWPRFRVFLREML